MLTVSDLLHLPYTRDLTEGGIAYALHALPYTYRRLSDSPYDGLRRSVANTALELAFRRTLSEQNIPFEVKGALPFTGHDRYDVILGNRRCEVKSFLISHPDQIAQIKQDLHALLRAPALVPSDQHAGEGHSPHDLYLFAFAAGWVTTTPSELQKVIRADRPYYLVHVMPGSWNQPSQWNPLGRLALKSEAEEGITVEIGGQDEGREMRSCSVELPPRTRVEVREIFFSLSYVHVKSNPQARIGIYSPIRKETHLIGSQDWSNIWFYGTGMYLAGYLSREEFSRRASFIPAGAHIFPYNEIHVKNLAVPMSELRPLSELFERARTGS